MGQRMRHAPPVIAGTLAVGAALLIGLTLVLRATDDPVDRATPTNMAPIVATGHIDVESGTYLAVLVMLEPGDAIRYRVEPGPMLAAETLVLTDPPTTRATYEELWPFIPSHLRPGSIDELVEGIERTSRTALNPGAVRSMFGDRNVVTSTHPGLPGEDQVGGGRTIADHVIALAGGEYTVVAQAVWGADEARLIVEVARARVADLEAHLADPSIVLDHDPWFDEDAFFRVGEPW